ncbi:hypothetical protein ES731_15465 [Psychroflexus gondwanensis]|jgi:hypothetical protein|nr:hypothetical protein ES731_15465 [Psychroflexus gondwanensis]
MKQALIIFTILIGFSSYSQNKFFNSTCDCIDQIEEKSNQSIIAEQIQNCFQKSFQNYNSEIGTILQNYVKENPETDMKSAQRNLSQILSEKLSEKCPKFKEIDKVLKGQQQNSENILNVIADEICAELKDKTNLTDKIVDPIIIEVTTKHQVSVYGQYNLDEKSEMKKFGTDLNSALMKKCSKYKTFVDGKNRGK